jgi:hypothetical protein
VRDLYTKVEHPQSKRIARPKPASQLRFRALCGDDRHCRE